MEHSWKRRLGMFAATSILIGGGMLGAAGSALADGDYGPILRDTDGDGIADTALIDRNSDGIIDAVVADTNYDGTVDAGLIDVDYNGSADIVFPKQQWRPATPAQDLPAAGDIRTNDFLDTAISGTPDAGYINLGDGDVVTWGLG